MKLTLSLLFIAQLFAFSAKAQTDTFAPDPQSLTADYVITNKGDTILCEINFGEYEINGISKEIKGEEIQEYYIAHRDSRMRAVFIDDNKKMQFLGVIEFGPISLYEMFTGTSTTWFIGKGSNRVTAFKSNILNSSKSRKDRKSYLAELLKDKPEVYDIFMADDKFNFDEIQNLVHFYNTGQPLTPFRKKASPKVTKVVKDDVY